MFLYRPQSMVVTLLKGKGSVFFFIKPEQLLNFFSTFDFSTFDWSLVTFDLRPSTFDFSAFDWSLVTFDL